MKDRDYQRIKDLIEKEVHSKNRKTLEELRDFLLEQISLLHVEHFDILNLSLMEFLTVKSYGIKFVRTNFIDAIQKIKRMNGTVLVFDTIGIGKEVLLKEKGIGTRTIGKYEHALNNYGYSLDTPLSEHQIAQFKIYQKEHLKTAHM